MAEFLDWLRNNLWAGWGIGALLLAGAELFTLDLTLLMLAAGAAMGGVTALVFPGLFWLQIAVAIITAVATLFLLRPTLLAKVRNAPGYRSSLDKLVGTAGRATSEITGTSGRSASMARPGRRAASTPTSRFRPVNRSRSTA